MLVIAGDRVKVSVRTLQPSNTQLPMLVIVGDRVKSFSQPRNTTASILVIVGDRLSFVRSVH